MALGTSCLTTPPGMSFCETTTNCFLFGATQLKLEEILSTSAATPCVYFRPDGPSKQTLVKCLDLLDRRLIAPCTPSPFRVVMLYNRKHCRVHNQWFAKYESTGRTNVDLYHMESPASQAHGYPHNQTQMAGTQRPVGACRD